MTESKTRPAVQLEKGNHFTTIQLEALASKPDEANTALKVAAERILVKHPEYLCFKNPDICGQLKFEKEIDGTLFGKPFGERLKATYSCLTGDGTPALATRAREMNGVINRWHAPKPEDMAEMVKQLGERIDTADNEVRTKDKDNAPYCGQQLAGIVYVMTSLLQPFDDGNKQTTRLLSLNYLHDLSPETLPYLFPLPSNDSTGGNMKLRQMISATDFLSKLPTEESVQEVVDELEIEQKSTDIVRQIIEMETIRGGGSKLLTEIDNKTRELGGNVDDRSGSSQKAGEIILDKFRIELVTKQVSRFLKKIANVDQEIFNHFVEEGKTDGSPEMNLLKEYCDNYMEALGESLETAEYRQPSSS